MHRRSSMGHGSGDADVDADTDVGAGADAGADADGDGNPGAASARSSAPAARRPSRRRYLTVVGAAATGLLAGCTATGLSDDEFDVDMFSNRFEPREYEVAAGGTVVWGNTGSRPHTVTAYEDELPDGAAYFASGGFGSQAAAEAGWPEEGGIASGETWSQTFETPGEYGYYCIPHEAADMVGTIVVEE